MAELGMQMTALSYLVGVVDTCGQRSTITVLVQSRCLAWHSTSVRIGIVQSDACGAKWHIEQYHGGMRNWGMSSKM